MLESVDQQLHELSGLVTDLLELSRNRTRRASARRTMRVALHERSAARSSGPGCAARAWSSTCEIEPWFVQGDPTGLDRAVVNLLDNAVKFSPAGGAGHRAAARRAGTRWRTRVPGSRRRTCRGCSSASTARIGAPLPGSGLGLAIVAQVAEETGGSMALEQGAQAERWRG